MTNVSNVLSVLEKQEEILVKSFHEGSENTTTTVERGKIFSRMNRILFDYQIGAETNTSMLESVLNQRVVLFNPETKQKVLELSYNRFPFLCKVFPKQFVRCVSASSTESQSIGSIQQRIGLGKSYYDVYNSQYEHTYTLILRKSYLRSKIQHRMSEYEILDQNKTNIIGRICPFSTDIERSQYGQATSIKFPQDMTMEMKATLVVAALILKTRLH
ncbi:unnamed protein product [Adineta ricciae]|uniref:Phospholipid scramblase n=1 Tax=Adineta ricciae TaxID=249248 RepID=A0A816D184_ADIRI|nr:unnamed protein product [Adineta ricciae]